MPTKLPFLKEQSYMQEERKAINSKKGTLGETMLYEVKKQIEC